MGRLFFCMLLSLTLLPAPKGTDCVKPVFFSMLFPQLTPRVQQEAERETIREAVFL